MKFYSERDLGMCGLACVLCSEEECLGCKARGCQQECGCSVFQCAKGRGIDGCYECIDFPCEEGMRKSIRNIAFNRYARQYGKQALLERLKTNFENGIAYHKPGSQKGDYDLISSEEDIIRMIRFGTHDPYVKCPTLETENLFLRLIQPEDAEDLLKCYSDPRAQELFNSVNCTGDFHMETLEEMNQCIDAWLLEYSQQAYIRFSIVDKATQRVIGTIEMFGKIGKYKTERGILRIDIISTYENKAVLTEIVNVCVQNFYDMFAVDEIATKAVPKAIERIESLLENGFHYCDMNDRELNYIRSK